MTPTRVAEVSPSGRGAVATLRAWGPDALAIADAAFRPNGRGRALADGPIGRLRVGRMGAGLGDEVVAVVLPGDPPEVEVQCHGGVAAIGLVVAALVERGARRASPRAWGRHATGSPLRADAGAALAEAPTLRAAEILLDQFDGALDAEVRAILAEVETDPDRALTQLDALIARGEFGVRLVRGWRVVLAGRPNVGKSRLINALAGYDRAIVAPTPGTTRDVVTLATALGGWPVELADTAGLRSTDDPVEAAGVERARATQRDADLVLVLLDRTAPLTPEDRAILADHPGALVVANKVDLPAAWDDAGRVAVSAERGDGLDALIAAIVGRLGLDAPPPPGVGVPTRPAHVRRLRAIREAIRRGDVDRARRSLARWLGAAPVAAGGVVG